MSDIAKPAPAWSAIELPATEGPDAGAVRRIHLVGVGGIGMSGIAEVLLTLGYQVSGSDLHDGEATKRLERLGGRIFLGHAAEHVDDAVDVVVVSSAVDDANPEVRKARLRRIPVIPRAEMLAELMRVKCGVAVAGAHGKTTTTSLVSAVLGQGGFDPTMVIGGRLRSLGGTNARLGRSRYMVAEADESDGSFLLLKPTIAVVTNIDREHMNYYGSMERLRDSYVAYVNGIPFYGRALLCVDCREVQGILPRLKKRYIGYGTSPDADLRAVDIHQQGLTTSFLVLHGGETLGRVDLAMPGEHAVRNALAAIGVGMEFGVPFRQSAEALSAFEGVMRRFEVRGEEAGVTVVDDYAHHPTELLAVLGAARKGFERRIVALFQPHRYSRLADLYQDFLGSFDDADMVMVTDVHAAGEQPMEGMGSERFAEELARRHRGEVVYVPAGAERPAAVAEQLRDGDLLLTLGAGDITRVGPEILGCLSGS